MRNTGVILAVVLVLFACEKSYDNPTFSKKLALAKKGDTTAQNQVGLMYYYGEDIDQDYIQAFHCLNKQQNKVMNQHKG